MQHFNPYGGNMPAQPHAHAQPPQSHSCSSPGKHPQTPAAPSHMRDPRYPQHTEGYYYQYGAAESGYPAEGAVVPADSPGAVGSWFDFSNGCYLKGFAVGAVVTLLLTNSSVQKAIIRGAVKIWSAVQGGVEEVKEQFHDVKAEMSLEKQH